MLVLAGFLAFGTGFTCDSDPSVGGPHPEPPEPVDVADPGFGSQEQPGAGGVGGSTVGGDGRGNTGVEATGGSPGVPQPTGGTPVVDGSDGDEDAGV